MSGDDILSTIGEAYLETRDHPAKKAILAKYQRMPS
jgi:hypothetical protein